MSYKDELCEHDKELLKDALWTISFAGIVMLGTILILIMVILNV